MMTVYGRLFTSLLHAHDQEALDSLWAALWAARDNDKLSREQFTQLADQLNTKQIRLSLGLPA